jgi:hypothetical protein
MKGESDGVVGSGKLIQTCGSDLREYKRPPCTPRGVYTANRTLGVMGERRPLRHFVPVYKHVHRLRLALDSRGLLIPIFHDELLHNDLVLRSKLCLPDPSPAYLPSLARNPAGGRLPVWRNLNGVLVQLLAVGMYGDLEPGKLHGTGDVGSHVNVQVLRV